MKPTKQYYVNYKVAFSLLVDADNENEALEKAKAYSDDELVECAESAIYAGDLSYDSIEELE